MQFVWLMLSRQFKFSRRCCDVCVNFEHFHQDCFSCKFLGSWWHTSLPVVFRDAISLSFPKYWSREIIFITHIFLAYFWRKKIQCREIITSLLFAAFLCHNSLGMIPFLPPPPVLIEISPQGTSWINQLCSQLWENSLTRWVSSPLALRMCEVPW